MSSWLSTNCLFVFFVVYACVCMCFYITIPAVHAPIMFNVIAIAPYFA